MCHPGCHPECRPECYDDVLEKLVHWLTQLCFSLIGMIVADIIKLNSYYIMSATKISIKNKLQLCQPIN